MQKKAKLKNKNTTELGSYQLKQTNATFAPQTCLVSQVSSHCSCRRQVVLLLKSVKPPYRSEDAWKEVYKANL